jgi:hypothetical protein
MAGRKDPHLDTFPQQYQAPPRLAKTTNPMIRIRISIPKRTEKMMSSDKEAVEVVTEVFSVS